jgi:hypothetical protein
MTTGGSSQNVPFIYRRQPLEAWTAEGYFFLYWFYRLALWGVLVGSLTTVASLPILIHSTPLASVFASVGIVLMALGGMALLGALGLKPTDRTVIYHAYGARDS